MYYNIVSFLEYSTNDVIYIHSDLRIMNCDYLPCQQRVLVALGHHDDALVVAERGRTRAFVDLLLERQLVDGADSWYNSLDSSPVTLEQILGHVRRQKATVVYYSLAAGYLYSWVISPDHGKGVVRSGVTGT